MYKKFYKSSPSAQASSGAEEQDLIVPGQWEILYHHHQPDLVTVVADTHTSASALSGDASSPSVVVD